MKARVADRVVRMTCLAEVKHEIRKGEVVLLLTGDVGNQRTRIELSLEHYEVDCLPSAIQRGVQEQLERWGKAQTALKGAIDG